MRTILITVALGLSTAQATPIQLRHQARLVDTDGAPINQQVTITVGIYADGSTATDEWSEEVTLTPQDGYISLVLGEQTASNPLQDSVFNGATRYVGVTLGSGVNAQELLPRTLIASVPSAVHATNVSGGAVSASTASVAGALTLGTDTDTCPDGAKAGSLRWDSAANALELCDGSDWRTVSTNAPGSCAAIKQQTPGATSGSFTVAPGGGTALEVYCDMSGTIGRTHLMHITGSTSAHVQDNSRVGAYPCTPSSGMCKLSTDEISRFIGEPGIQIFEVDPDSSGYLSFFQRAASDTQVWPTNLEGSNRSALVASPAWSWILTSYQSYSAAANNTGGDVGDYASANHYYPTPYANQQLFFRGGGTGMRANTNWGPTGYSDGLPGSLWVY